MFSSTSTRRWITNIAALSLLFTTPLAIGFTTKAAHAAPVEITIVGSNDFHGRLTTLTGPGAAEYAGAVEQIRSDNPNTIFAAAGDLIGATEFESFINDDKPTIDVLNAMDLDVSAVGNHELDKGYDDLVSRVMAPYDATDNPTGGAEWEYIAANIDEPGGADEIAESWTVDMGTVRVGFVGAVTEALPSLVSPAGIEGLTVTDIVGATNAEADALRADGADIVVLLVHEGAPTVNCDAMDDNPDSPFGSIVTGVDGDVDAIISGHTHLPYDCRLPVPGEVGTRPVVSAGQYGQQLNRLDFTVEDTTGLVTGVETELLDLTTTAYPIDEEVEGIVEDAIEAAEGPGSVELGEIRAPFARAQWLRPAAEGEQPQRVDNRGGESTLGNLVAEVQRWATRSQERGGAQIAFMNPGGLRADMLGVADDGYPEALSYRQAANVQPFANTLVNMTLTGRQIRRVLEEQWQPDGASRPFLRLGTSRGFEYAYNPTADPGRRIRRMWLNGQPIVGSREYSVTVNSFLASGGDNFTTLAEGTDRRDTGMVDLESMVDYMAAKASTSALAPDYEQHAVGVRMPRGNKVKQGGNLRVRLSSLAMTFVDDVRDRRVHMMLGKKRVGVSEVDNSLQVGDAAAQGGFDEAGQARVIVEIPENAVRGKRFLRIVGPRTGTDIKVPIRITRN